MAVNPRAVAKALPARSGQAAGPSSGGYGALPALTSGASPLVASYDQWTNGRAYGSGLPRDVSAFLSQVAFGPSVPIQPTGINAPDPDSGRPEPRRFEYPVAWNLPHGTPGNEGLKLASFTQLRTIADAYSVARSCIRVRVQEILGLEWEIVPTREAEKAMRGDRAARRDFDERRGQALKFFRRPDPGKYHNFQSWLSAVLEDVLVVDALSIYLQPTRARGKGLLGSSLGALCHIAGDTVRPLLDALGGTPAPPNPAFQVYDYGVARVDMMTAMTAEDLDEMGAAAAEYTGDQLMYMPYHTRSWTPYGFPPLEQALVPVLTGIARQQFQLSYFSDGSVPGMFVTGGDPNATPNQLRELQDALNAMAGDPAWKHKIIVLPNGSSSFPMKPIPLADQLDEIIMTQVCMAYDVMPMELGIAPKVSTTQSPGAANQMAKASESVNQRKALKPLLKWLKTSLFDFVLQDVAGQADMQWKWEGLEEGEDEASQVGLLVEEVGHGLKSIDEARVERGAQPWGLPLTSDPVYFTATGIVPIGAIDPNTGRPAGLQPLVPGQPGATADGQPPPAPPTAPGTPGGGAATPAHAAGQAGAQTAAGGAGASTGQQSAPKPAATPAAGAGSAPKPSTPAAQPAGKPGKTKPGKSKPKVNKFGALRELDLIRRRIVKAADPGTALWGWELECLPAEVFRSLVRDVNLRVPPADAIEKARAAVRDLAGHPHAARRDQVVAAADEQIRDRLTQLGAGVASGAVPTAGFVDQGVGAMYDGIRAGLYAGARHALADRRHPGLVKADDGDDQEEDLSGFDEDPDPGDAYRGFLDRLADRRAHEQRHYLENMLAAVLAAGGVDAMASRIGAYGGQATSAYEEGYGLTTLAGVDDPQTYSITWHTTSERPCGLCAARDGKTYTLHGLPGWPGDLGFGDLCAGGANCRCYLEYSEGDVRAYGVNSLMDSAYVARNRDLAAAQQQRLADVTAAREAFVASLPAGPAERAAARDAARAELAAERGGWPSDVPAADVAARVPAHLKHGGHADATHEVYAYLARQYPASVLDWVKAAHWHGPVKVKLKDIDAARRPGGARDQDKVDTLTAAINDGGRLHPVVLVQTPSGKRLEIADGWHRTEAAEHAGKSKIRAWIGVVDSDTGPWGEAMNEAKLTKAGSKVSQESVRYRPADTVGRTCGTCSMYDDYTCTLVAGTIDPGAVCDEWDPAGPAAAGLAVVAADTGRVLMLQRAITDGDPAGGMWEFPGGTLDPGETPEQAAGREWAEETGCHLPDGALAGTWTSANGVYQGYVLVVANEDTVPMWGGRDQVTNPDDPDGDQLEALAWWDPDHLAGNPALRTELAADLDAVRAALPALSASTT